MHGKCYSNELKAEAVWLVTTSQLTTAGAGAKLGIPAEVVRVWVRRHRESKGRGWSPSPPDIQKLQSLLTNMANERDELVRLASRLLSKVG